MSVPAGENTLIDAATGAPFPAVPADTPFGSSRTLGWRGILVEWHRLPPDELPPPYVIGHGISVSTTSHPIPFGWRGRRGWQDRVINPGESHLLTHGELNTPRRYRPFDGLSLVLDPQFVADVVCKHVPPNRIEFVSQTLGRRSDLFRIRRVFPSRDARRIASRRSLRRHADDRARPSPSRSARDRSGQESGTLVRPDCRRMRIPRPRPFDARLSESTRNDALRVPKPTLVAAIAQVSTRTHRLVALGSSWRTLPRKPRFQHLKPNP
jgi:hypothetical protein